jgi:hypothetical protein
MKNMLERRVHLLTELLMRTSNWKNVEREAAKLFGGVRTGCNGESRRDVEHPTLSIEVKHRKVLPDWLHSAMGQAVREAEHRKPIVYLHERHMKFEDGYVVLRAKDFKDLCPDTIKK